MADPKFVTVTLDQPFQRGETTVEAIRLRKPAAGELRGLQLAQLTQLDYASLETLLPRISEPMLTKSEVAQLDPADLLALSSEVVDFLLTRSARAALPQA
jgi:hypothetical protein